MTMDIAEFLKVLVQQWGYLGAFIVSVIGNAIPFFPVPYLIAIVLLATSKSINPIFLGIAGGLGGGVGKLVTYYIGKFTGTLVYKGDERQLIALKRLLGNYGALAAFIMAATPSPDDAVLVVLGAIEYNLKKFFIAVTLGKIALTTGITVVVQIFAEGIEGLFGEGSSLEIIVISLILTVVIMLLIDKVDWISIMEEVEKMGWKGYISFQLKKFLEKRKPSS
ncbi:MAG: hypothetical protein DRJ47_04605 [Thermoprotei archaeon]|nr:MAG: hypothetical protein DRJ47_04605 [Thermoprotei archaeon]